MNNKFNFLIIILLIFNTGVSIYMLNNKNSTTNNNQNNISQQLTQSQQIPQAVQESINKTTELKQDKPYLFLSPEELSQYNCNSISDSKEKQQCIDIGTNYRVSLLFKNLKQEEITSFDCTKIKDITLIDKCTNYIKQISEMNKINTRPSIPK